MGDTAPYTLHCPTLVLTVEYPRAVELGSDRLLGAYVDPPAVDRPDLDDEVISDIAGWNGRWKLILDRLIAQEERRLLEVIVEERVRLREGIAVDDEPAGRADEHHAAEEPHQQARAQAGPQWGHPHAGGTR